ncbi:Outer membrane efflux protein BepC precursor [Enhygromyxa salina]|uniref:Outer membrane efflux protein BepC n=1 Tax=Enhygromyxa salina TaxID=215803 RepID=A0A2S9XCQ9_9BACT|nr:Outer membrane efflux protein BepC precursor [Enhygromyxa salina]
MLCLACVARGERELRAELDRAGDTLAAVEVGADAPSGAGWAETEQPSFDGTPEAYVAHALAHDHELRATWERWRAASHRVARERRLPMPTVSYSVFVAPVETRVGPQRQRLGVRQHFPWPGALLAGADAATAAARVEQHEFEAAALEVRARVLAAYWRLWLLREVELVEREQLELFEALTELSRARLELGQATLADIQQLELGRARLADQVAGLGEAQIEASAMLVAAVAAPPGTETPTSSALPVLEQPAVDEASLRAVVVEHPLLERWEAQGEVGDLRVKQARHARAPALSLGVDWIEIGPARVSGVADSGKDAVSVTVGLELPLWQANYAHDQRAAEADAAAARAEWASVRDRAAAQLSVALSRVRDTARRAALHEHTLIPQAEGALESTLGGYATGEGVLAAILLAERDLLELRLSAVRLHAEHAIAWAELERVVGRPVEGRGEGTEASAEAGDAR